jgi:putative tryptophan/tyrosine transport system substrate-binding protein
MRRREFVMLVGSATAAWPLAALAQQPAMPMIGFLYFGAATEQAPRVAAFKQGLSETGYVEGQNVAIEYRRYAQDNFDRLPVLAADLVSRNPAAIFANGPASIRMLKGYTTTIPIVFTMGEDPVKEGLVASLNRPGGNITGFSAFANLLFPKRLQLLHETVPPPSPLALLVNPDNPNAEPDSQDTRAAAVTLKRELIVLTASTEHGIEEAFAAMVQQRVGGLIVGVDGLFIDRRDQIFALTAQHAMPAIYEARFYTTAGGLMSYGTDDTERYRQPGTYVGRILKGEKPADLPVFQATKFELVINLKTAKTLKLTIPPDILAIADDVID